MQEGEDGPHQDSIPSLAATALGASGLAVVVPLLTLLGPRDTFFAAHAAGRLYVIGFAALVVLGPASVFLGVALLVRRFAPRLLRPLTNLTVGGLLAVFLVSLVSRGVGIRTVIYPVAVLVLTFLIFVMQRRPEVRRLVRISAAIPILLAVWFLFFSSVASIVLPQESLQAGEARSDSSVLILILDELPTAALLDGDLNIDSERFPGFAALAETSTWYPEAMTVSSWTHFAVPATLTGTVPRFESQRELAAKSLFSMLEPTHNLGSIGPVTNLCRFPGCDLDSSFASMLDDAAILYLHQVLPRSAATRWLPEVTGRFAHFRVDHDYPTLERNWGPHSEPDRFRDLLEEIETSTDPSLWLGHFLFPHGPWVYLPDGRLYDWSSDFPGLMENEGWGTDLSPLELTRQRFVLQLKAADQMIGELLATLERAGADDTMVVVTSDHGTSFSPGSPRGVPYTEDKAPSVLPIPLFVKYPGQDQGVIDDRHAQLVDIVPTIVEVLDVELPESWQFDGRSLLKPNPAPRQTWFLDVDESLVPPTSIDLSPVVQRYRELFGDWRDEHDVFAWGPHAELVGREAPERSGPSGPSARLIETPWVSSDISYDPGTREAPALIQIQLREDPGTDWFALSVNGSIAGLGRLWADNGRHRGGVIVDPQFLRPGANEIDGYLIDEDGELTPFPISPPR